ncbi:hypothetical protein BCR34DRAFT_578443 [Clohesyomyces aquaticus]|uniref:SnoaL-like domain-containing protein n=1 Tax=Clohesyomyces aquaticus TaxID=1231657 RepID=A0A1Y1YG82_9PLEO|nr:hypothetical protein BCR34DRAFT_578443 [Clohesyomyces aquaticus]
MSYPTQPVFVAEGDSVAKWAPEIRAHPAIDWMHHFTKEVFDARNWDVPGSTYCTPDFVFQKSDGTEINGAEEGWAADKAMYAPFTAHKHEPRHFRLAETTDGWDLLGNARMYVNVPGQPGPGEKKVKDLEGNEWDAVLYGTFRFIYVKDADGYQGIKLRRVELYSDPLPALGLLLKRGVMTPEQLLG